MELGALQHLSLTEMFIKKYTIIIQCLKNKSPKNYGIYLKIIYFITFNTLKLLEQLVLELLDTLINKKILVSPLFLIMSLLCCMEVVLNAINRIYFPSAFLIAFVNQILFIFISIITILF